jgi:hypothetical protein
MAIVKASATVKGSHYSIPLSQDHKTERLLEIEALVIPVIEFYKTQFDDTDEIFLVWDEEKHIKGKELPIAIDSPTISIPSLIMAFQQFQPPGR